MHPARTRDFRMLTAMPKAPVMLSRKDAAIVQSAGPIAFLQQSAANGCSQDSDDCDDCDDCATVAPSRTKHGDCDDCAVCKSEHATTVQPSHLNPQVSFDPSINVPYGKLGFGAGMMPNKLELKSTITTPALLSEIITTKKKSKPATIPEDMDRVARLEAWKDSTRAYFASLPPEQQAEVAKGDCMQRLMSPETFDPQQQARWLASLPVEEQKEIAEMMPDATVEDLTRQAKPVAPAASFPGDLKDELTAITQMCETASDLKDILDIMQAAPATFLPASTRFQLGDHVVFKTEEGLLEGEVVEKNYREAAEDGKMVTYKIRCQRGECYYAIDDGDDLVWGKEAAQENDSSESSSESDDDDDQPFVPMYGRAPYAMSRRCIMPSHMDPFFPPPLDAVSSPGSSPMPMYMPPQLVQTPAAPQQTRSTYVPARTMPLMYMSPHPVPPPAAPQQTRPAYMPTQPVPPPAAPEPQNGTVYMPPPAAPQQHAPAQPVPPPAAPQPQNGTVYMPPPAAPQPQNGMVYMPPPAAPVYMPAPPAVQIYRHCAR